jgi:anti-anti-sigma regulatory factor
MLKIERSSNRGVVFSLSGRIETEDVAELQRLLSLEATGQDIAFDLQDVTLVDRNAMKFLARCESKSIKLENCPAYVREWIAAERNQKS